MEEESTQLGLDEEQHESKTDSAAESVKSSVWHRINVLRVVCFGIILVLMTLIAVFLFVKEDELIADDDSSSSIKEQENSSQAQQSSSADESSKADSSVPERVDSGKQGELAGLETKLTERLKDLPGTWSVYVKNLKTGDTVIINDTSFYPASVIKLFAMGASYQQINDGRINEKDYYGEIYNMAVMSNNRSFNKMVWTLGRTYISEWCAKCGYTRTFQNHGLHPAPNADGLETSDKPNSTCARDVAHMLEDIYNGKCVSKEASEKMLEILNQQYYVNKIPYGLPYGTKFASKSGDTDDQSHDAAIVFSPNADYILVIMSEETGNARNHSQYFIELSSMVFSYINPGVQTPVPQ